MSELTHPSQYVRHGRAHEGSTPTGTTVLYIAGSGRSGSTLLERILGEIPGFVNVGELIELFRRVAVDDERCGCGEPFSACPFWQSVGQRAFGGWSPQLVADIARSQRDVARQRRMPWLFAHPHAPRAFEKSLNDYIETYERLYAAIVAESGAQVVVDASKWPAQAMSLSRSPRIDLRLLHLVRDVRGVAYSWAKAGVSRPQSGDQDGVMATHPVARTAVRWSAFQAESVVVGSAVKHSARVRYEDLVSRPLQATEQALTKLGFELPEGGLSHLDDSGVRLPASHGLAGNPSRFRTGYQKLRLDEEWRSAMPSRDRRVTTALGLPSLAMFGYLQAAQAKKES